MVSRFRLGVLLVVVACAQAILLAQSPQAPAAAPPGLPGDRVELAGTVEVSYEDHRGFSRLTHVLDTGRGRYTLQFPGEPPAWTTGQRVRMRGVRVQNTLALDGDGVANLAAAPAALAGATGDQRTLVMLVNFRNSPTQPYTPAFAASVVFGSTDGYLRENSAGATSLSGDVVGWHTIDMDDTVCDTTQLATKAQQAATAAGANLSLYSRYVYAFPTNACAWWGLGSVGGNPSQAWINGELALDVAGHELGHNLGLYHSRNMDCGATPIGPSCTVDEYGDTLDLMGATRGHFNAFQKERLGWLASPQVVEVTSGGTYNIEPLETLTGGVKALKILKATDPATGRRTYYYVELRQALGYDAFMSGWTNVLSGVSIHTGSESGGNTSYLLDMTPETATWYDPALVSGQTFSDPAAGVTIAVSTVSSAGALVSVTVGAPPPTCTRANPTVSVTPGAPAAVSPGTTMAFTASLTNNDSAACGTSTFALSPIVPNGWPASMTPASIALAPGASSAATMSVTSPATAPAGAYAVSARAVDAADATRVGSGSATVTVTAPAQLSVQASTDRASYARGSTVNVSAGVAAGASPVSGASVAFRIRKADGKYVNATATTNVSGVATYQLRLRSRDPQGSYTVTATATSAGETTAGSTTFSVY